MINVTILPNATGGVIIAGNHYPLAAATTGQAREQAIDLITRYVQHLGKPQQVHVVDVAEALQLTISPDGTVVSSLTSSVVSGVPDAALIPPSIERSDSSSASISVELHHTDGSVVPVSTVAIIGRRPQTQEGSSERAVAIRADNRTASATHARIDITAGGVNLTDLKSSNGTTITRNGVTVDAPAETPIPLQSGDLLHVGEDTFTVHLRSQNFTR